MADFKIWIMESANQEVQSKLKTSIQVNGDLGLTQDNLNHLLQKLEVRNPNALIDAIMRSDPGFAKGNPAASFAILKWLINNDIEDLEEHVS